jgi:hypothetical protein
MYLVPVLLTPVDLCTTTTRGGAGLPGRLPSRVLPTLNGFSVPPDARWRQLAPRALTSCKPDHRQGIRGYTYVTELPSPYPLRLLTSRVSSVLPECD